MEFNERERRVITLIRNEFLNYAKAETIVHEIDDSFEGIMRWISGFGLLGVSDEKSDHITIKCRFASDSAVHHFPFNITISEVVAKTTGRIWDFYKPAVDQLAYEWNASDIAHTTEVFIRAYAKSDDMTIRDLLIGHQPAAHHIYPQYTSRYGVTLSTPFSLEEMEDAVVMGAIAHFKECAKKFDITWPSGGTPLRVKYPNGEETLPVTLEECIEIRILCETHKDPDDEKKQESIKLMKGICDRDILNEVARAIGQIRRTWTRKYMDSMEAIVKMDEYWPGSGAMDFIKG
jgi:hypothetical protein